MLSLFDELVPIAAAVVFHLSSASYSASQFVVLDPARVRVEAPLHVTTPIITTHRKVPSA